MLSLCKSSHPVEVGEMEYAAGSVQRGLGLLMREKKPAGRPMPESLLAKLWSKRAARQAEFRTGNGTRFRVLYPGHPGGGAGPDFRDALLQLDGVGLVRGDVEIHLHQRDWRSHGHGSDPNYNGVVLHAALEVESPATELQSGQEAPVVSLKALLHGDDPPESGPNTALWEALALHGYPLPANKDELESLLDKAGDRRFLSKSAWFQRLLAEQGPDQVLYEGLLEGLGYRFNQQPFLKLAQRAPYDALAKAAASASGAERAEIIESQLLALAGFAALDGGGEPLPRRGGLGPAMSVKEWRLFRVRPSNHPRRRIAGAARILDRFVDLGLAHGLIQAAAGPDELTAALTVEAGAGGKGSLIGRDRARDLAVNAALPFMHGLAAVGQEPDTAQAALELYSRFPKLQENELTREMAAQLIDPAWAGAASTARRQQGLLHLAALLRGEGGP